MTAAAARAGAAPTASAAARSRDVRARYAAAARPPQRRGCGCRPAVSSATSTVTRCSARRSTGRAPRRHRERRVSASLGCGVPTAVADLHEGETVLDLGSGAGADVLICARRVGPTGKAIGLDMTDEMLDLARANAAEAGVENVEFVKGYLEEIPLAGRERRRRDLQLRDQPLRRQAQGPRRGRARAAARRPVRGLRRDRRPRHGRGRPRPTWPRGPGASPAR